MTVAHPPSTQCTVPGFSDTWYRPPPNNPAQVLWESHGFTTTVGLAPGNNKTKSWIIKGQSLVGGQLADCNDEIDISDKAIPVK